MKQIIRYVIYHENADITYMFRAQRIIEETIDCVHS
jgi:hypothetical protein